MDTALNVYCVVSFELTAEPFGGWRKKRRFIQTSSTLVFKIDVHFYSLIRSLGVHNKMSRLPPKERVVVVVKVLLRAARNKRRWWWNS